MKKKKRNTTRKRTSHSTHKKKKGIDTQEITRYIILLFCILVLVTSVLAWHYPAEQETENYEPLVYQKNPEGLTTE